MVADPDAFIRLLDGLPPQRLRRAAPAPIPAAVRPGLRLERPRALAWKTALLAASTLAFVPILLWKHDLAAGVYVAALVAVHVIGLAVILLATGKDAWADTRALAWRLGGIAVLVVLLSFVGKGLTTTTGALFWGTLVVVWALHTLGAILFHLRGDPRACPIPGISGA